MEHDAVVIDVMTPEDFAACHVAGAQNACIYEMVFPDRIAESIPGLHSEVVLYDATGAKRAAELAAERLTGIGYANVSILKGGLAAWRKAGLPVETGNPAVVEETPRNGMYQVDTGKSVLEWAGRNINNRHYGRIAIKSGELAINGAELTAGNLVLDMNSITNLDLQDSFWNGQLIRHLKSDDFFAVERFPTASFRLDGWKKVPGGAPEAPGGIATGELTVMDVTRPVKFPAMIAPQEPGVIKAHAFLDIDRTDWNVGYGSGKLYERLGMHLVHDIISLELFVLARMN
jgi:rhodanese-related sulfurtransferase